MSIKIKLKYLNEIKKLSIKFKKLKYYNIM